VLQQEFLSYHYLDVIMSCTPTTEKLNTPPLTWWTVQEPPPCRSHIAKATTHNMSAWGQRKQDESLRVLYSSQNQKLHADFTGLFSKHQPDFPMTVTAELSHLRKE